MKRLFALLKRFWHLYMGKRLNRAAAALAYFLTSTLFPLLVILYTLLGSSEGLIERIIGFVGKLMAEKSAETIADFLHYVAKNNSRSMMMAAFLLLLTSASAGVRTLQATIGELQGKQRFRGVSDILFSLVFALLFTAAIYFAFLVMMTGPVFLNWINQLLPILNVSKIWRVLRFPLLGFIQYWIIYGAYLVSEPRSQRYPLRVGALLATALLVGISYGFSVFIGVSARYPMVYGSLASIILLMLWLYACSMAIFAGAAMNVALRDQRLEERQKRFAPETEEKTT